MYGRQFGFARPIFSDGVAQDEAVFRTPATLQIARDLEIALTRKDSVAILAGISGTGKTTIACDALKSIGTRLAFSCISQPPLTAHELLEQLLTDFGFEPYKKSRVERLQLWRQFLSEMTATDTRVCLLVENAEEIDPLVMQSLHNLTRADAAMSPGANVVMTMTFPPEYLLSTPDMLAFSQRVRLRRSLDPLTEAEIDDYLEFKCRYGEVDRARVFSAAVAGTLFDYSGGIIRVIDSLLESALIAVAGNDSRPLGAEQIAAVAEEHFGMMRLEPAEIDALLDQSTEAYVDQSTDAYVDDSQAGFLDEPDYSHIPTLMDYVAASGDDDFAEDGMSFARGLAYH